jgi:hypothetical protein
MGKEQLLNHDWCHLEERQKLPTPAMGQELGQLLNQVVNLELKIPFI